MQHETTVEIQCYGKFYAQICYNLFFFEVCDGADNVRSERTAIGSTLSAAMVSILVGLAASNLGILPYEAPAYSIVMEFLLPMAVPLLLFKADLRRIFQSTGTLLMAFLVGSGR